MKLSIITVNLNNCDGLQKTIDSVVSQTFTDYEWIVIDGGSTDGSKELIEQYSEHFAYWVSEPDKGIYNAMNKGISHAQGDWLQFLNSGDWLCNEHTLYNIFTSEHEGDILYGDYFYHNKSENTKVVIPDIISLYWVIRPECFFCHQAFFYRKEIFFTHSYNEKYKVSSDTALTIQLICEGKKMVHIPIETVYYSAGGISSQLTHEQAIERDEIIKTHTPFHIYQDFLTIDNIYKKQYLYHSRKIFRIISKNTDKIIILLNKILTFIERQRLKNTWRCR